MPMIVMHRMMPAVRWPSASSQPKSRIQMMLPITEATPAVRRISIDRPNGQITYDAIRKHAMVNGIVMMKMAAMMPNSTYRIAIHQPQRINQITLRISLMIHSLPVTARLHPDFAGARTSSVASRRAVLAAISSTAWSKAAALWAAGARKPLIFLTYCSAAARMSASVTASAYGGRKVLMERHIERSLRVQAKSGLAGADWELGLAAVGVESCANFGRGRR